MVQFKWVPLVNHFSICCCRCTLRTGTLIIAWLGLIGELLQVMDTIVQLYYYKDIMEEAKEEQEQKQLLIMEEELLEDNTQMPILNSNINSDDDDDEVVTSTQPGYFSVAETREALLFRLLFGILHVIVHACLLHGAWKEKPKFMLPYIIINFIFIIISFCLIILLSLFIASLDVFVGIVVFLIGSAVIVLTAYLWAGVYTYYRHLTEPILPQQETQLKPMDYIKPEETEPIVNSEEIQKAYANIEEKLRYSQPQPV